MDLLPDLWKQEYWLPPGVTWEDMDKLPDSSRPNPLDLLMSVPLALGFLLLRFTFERYCAPPMGRCLGVKNRPVRAAAPSPKLESFYSLQSRQPSQNQIASLIDVSGKTQRQIETWFHLRRSQDRPTQTKKFNEAAWRFVFYFTSFFGGLLCLIDAPWFWDLRECWRQYPVQPMERAHYWYYMLEMGFYGSLLLRISVDVKRKDFREQVIHHLATMFLLSFSYCANYIRVGTLVMLLHDVSDILLESAKMLNYGTGWRKMCDAVFVVFAAVFLVTRLVIFPCKILHTTLVLSMETFRPFFGFYFFNVLLMVLQALHVFWASLILRMVSKFLKGEMEKDERSDEESEPDEPREENMEDDGDRGWKSNKDAMNNKLSMLSNNCVLNNLTNHRANIAERMRKAQ